MSLHSHAPWEQMGRRRSPVEVEAPGPNEVPPRLQKTQLGEASPQMLGISLPYSQDGPPAAGGSRPRFCSL